MNGSDPQRNREDSHVIAYWPRDLHPRLRTVYLDRSGFRFSLHHVGAGNAVARVFRKGADIKVGDPTFDFAYVIRASDERRIRTPFADEVLSRIRSAQRSERFSVQDGGGGDRGSRPVDALRRADEPYARPAP